MKVAGPLSPFHDPGGPNGRALWASNIKPGRRSDALGNLNDYFRKPCFAGRFRGPTRSVSFLFPPSTLLKRTSIPGPCG
jgi:hypothetical protein